MKLGHPMEHPELKEERRALNGQSVALEAEIKRIKAFPHPFPGHLPGRHHLPIWGGAILSRPNIYRRRSSSPATLPSRGRTTAGDFPRCLIPQFDAKI
jgi:hypothetical protein